MLLFFCLELRLLFVNSFNLSLYYVLLTLLSFIESQRFTHKQNMSFLLTYGSLQNGWNGSSNSEGMQRILCTVSAEHSCGIWTSFLGWIWRRLSFLKFLRNFTLIWTIRANLFAYDHYVEWPKINSWVSWGVNTQTSRLWLICSCSILLPSNVVRNVLLLFVVLWGFFFLRC